MHFSIDKPVYFTHNNYISKRSLNCQDEWSEILDLAKTVSIFKWATRYCFKKRLVKTRNISFIHTHLSVFLSHPGCGIPDSSGTTILFRFVFFKLPKQSSHVAAYIITLIISAPYCWQVSMATYLLKVFLFHSLSKPLTPGQYNHYVAELAFYWSLMFSQFTDIKRKVSQHQLTNHYCAFNSLILSIHSPNTLLCISTVFPVFLHSPRFTSIFLCIFHRVFASLLFTSFIPTSIRISLWCFAVAEQVRQWKAAVS